MPQGGWVVTHEDITERRRAEAKISHLALHDGLTDLANRNLFEEQISHCFERVERDEQFAVEASTWIISICKRHVGHPFGDKLLQQVGVRLRLGIGWSDQIYHAVA